MSLQPVKFPGSIGLRRETPLFVESVAAGFPSPAQDYVEHSLDLNEYCIEHPAATYMVRVEGDSMVDAGIFDGDVLIVDRSLDARHNDIVVASVNGDLTVKQLELKPRPALMPRNPKYQPIDLNDESDLNIFGVVTKSIRHFRTS